MSDSISTHQDSLNPFHKAAQDAKLAQEAQARNSKILLENSNPSPKVLTESNGRSHISPINLGSTKKLRIPYVIEDDDGNPEDYVLIEAKGTASTEYEARKLSGVKLDKRGMPTEVTGKGHDANLLLLSNCFYKMIGPRPETWPSVDKRKRELVPFETLCDWGTRITNPLCEKLLLISKLGGTPTKQLIREKIAQLQAIMEELEDTEKNG